VAAGAIGAACAAASGALKHKVAIAAAMPPARKMLNIKKFSSVR
jgi:hypothetical protein